MKLSESQQQALARLNLPSWREARSSTAGVELFWYRLGKHVLASPVPLQSLQSLWLQDLISAQGGSLAEISSSSAAELGEPIRLEPDDINCPSAQLKQMLWQRMCLAE